MSMTAHTYQLKVVFIAVITVAVCSIFYIRFYHEICATNHTLIIEIYHPYRPTFQNLLFYNVTKSTYQPSNTYLSTSKQFNNLSNVRYIPTVATKTKEETKLTRSTTFATTLSETTTLSNIVKDTPEVKEFMNAVNYYKMTSEEKTTYLETLQEFANLCYANNITFFMYGGSLIGAYRHHGIIPWDEDIDVIMSYNDRPKFDSLFKNPNIPILLSKAQGVKWKVYLKTGTVPTRQSWPWPFIDVFFWDETATSYYDRTDHSYTYLKSDVMPLIMRPFDTLMMPMPRNGYKYTTFASTKCCTGSWDHKREIWSGSQSKCVACDAIRSRFPFVYRLSHNATHNREELRQYGKVLQVKYELT